MKKLLFVSISACLLAVSCSKSDDPTPTPSAEKYMSITAGNTWNYQYTDNITPANSGSYTVTSTNQDSTAAGKIYHVFTNTSGPNDYYNITGSSYYTMQAFSLGTTDTTLENLYLKDDVAAGISWNQSYTIKVGGVDVAVNVVNKIEDKGISKTVGTTNYTNVIHVTSTISSPTISLVGGTLTTNIHYYYAPKFGMIQNDSKIDLVVLALTLNEHTDSRTTLTSVNF